MINNKLKFIVRYIKFIIIIFLAFFAENIVFGQTDAKFERLTRNEGLSHNNVYSIMQDKYGFMWFGAQEGLNRYDGYNFKQFYSEPNNLNSSSSSNFGKIFEDSKGFIWLGTYRSGLDKYDPINRIFKHFDYDEKDTNSLSNSKIRGINEDKYGNIWIATSGGGLNKYNPLTDTFTHFLHSETNKNSISSNDLNCLFIDNTGNFWIATSKGVDFFDIKTNQFKHYVLGSESYDITRNISISSVIVDEKGIVWLGSSNGVFTINPITNKINNYKQDISNPQSLGSNIINVIYEDSYGTIWIGTENGGLNKFIPEKNAFENYIFDIKNPYSISSNRIWSIYEDQSKILWIGTKGGGVNKLDLKRKKFEHLYYSTDKKTGLPHPSVSAIVGDSTNNIWIGTDGGGVCKYSEKEGITDRFYEKPFDKNSLSDDQIWSSFTDKKNRIWLGMHTGGLDCIISEKGKYIIKKYINETNNPHSISNNQVNTIFEDNLGMLWIGTRNGLNKLIDTIENVAPYFQRINDNFTDTASSFSSNYITSIYQDHYNYMWIGTYTNGLNRLNPENGEIIKFENIANNNNSLSSNNIQTIFEDHYGNLWIGTGSGLNKLNRKTNTFKRYFVKDGLPSNEIMAILEDNSGFLWISTSKGLSKFNPINDEMINFNISDGLYSDGFNWNSAYKNVDGKLFFGTNSGMVSFYPSEIQLNSFIPKIVITKFSIIKDDKWVSNDMFISNYNDENNRIILSYENNIFSVEFAAMDFTNPNNNTFQYKIDGIDNNWIDYGNKRFIMVTNLKPGDYVLRIRGTNNDKTLNESGIALAISVKPPFWNSIWFYLIIIVIGFLIVIWVYSFLIELKTNKILEDKNLQLEITNKKLIESEKSLKLLNNTKDKFFSIIAHDLRNPFNPLLSLTELLDDDYDTFTETERKEFIKEIKGGAKKLHNLLENLLQWALSQTHQIKFKQEKLELNSIINKNIDLLEINAEKKQISLINNFSSIANIMADENMINSIIRNLLNNAMKFSPENSQIDIFIRDFDKQYIVEVADNGIGISKEDLPEVFGGISKNSSKKVKGAGSGLGLILCKDFVEQNGGKIWVTSNLNEGSVFHFTVNKAI
ncbi:MAG: hypothetical protein JXR51_12770 [Bacteroidales bacterium]|nr:hypothetical protein [Bacteroidales bacterium]MBN2758043.1 hypothetical protein [Bacteroidales bacterium]